EWKTGKSNRIYRRLFSQNSTSLEWSSKMLGRTIRAFMWMMAVLPVFPGAISNTSEAQVPVPAADPSGVIGTIRRQPPGPPERSPRLKDGTVNLGRVHGEKGVWGLPVIANFAQVAGGVPKDFRGNLRRGASAEPHIPFQSWAAAVYNYNSLNLSKFDPEGYCL